MMWFRLLVVCVGIWGISGCALQAERTHSEPTAHQASKADQAAIQALFDQPYIDPLTRFLAQPQGQQLPAALQDKVRAERARRCEVVAQRYADRPLTARSLARYRAGYQYSCPDDVEAFAQRLKRAQAAPAEDDSGAANAHETSGIDQAQEEAQGEQSAEEANNPSQAASAEGADISPQQLNDCYLLTQIRNFSDALEACQEPAEKGDLKAQRNMAMMTYTLEDYEQAKHWAEEAAPQSGQAASILGEIYAQGHGVSVDIAQARHWFLQAVHLGYEPAQPRLDALPADESP